MDGQGNPNAPVLSPTAIPKKEEIFQEIRILNSPKPDVPACKRLLLKLLTMLNRVIAEIYFREQNSQKRKAIQSSLD